MSGKTIVLITGGNTGLGFETVKHLVKSSNAYEIIIGARSTAKADAAIATLSPQSHTTLSSVEVTLESDESIQKAADTIKAKFGRIDVLVNNAGAQFDADITEGKIGMREGWNKSWDINVTGTHILTTAFAPLLVASPAARLVFITSGLSSISQAKEGRIPPDQSPASGWPKKGPSFTAYRSTKTGMNMMYAEWTRLLQQDGVKTFAVAPGMLATGLGGRPEVLKAAGAIDPAIGGDVVRSVIEGERDDDAGKVVRRTDVQAW